MATNKNITMKQYNGLDYDTLYPKTTPEQVGAVSYKAQTLTNAQKTQARKNIDAASTNEVNAIPKPNLFINPLFQIWQLYPSGWSGVPVNRYVCDGWRVLSSDGSKQNNLRPASPYGMANVTGPNCTISQFLENAAQFNGLQMTCSVLKITIEGSQSFVTATKTASGWTDSTDILAFFGTSNQWRWINPGETIIGAKLEVGTQQTFVHKQANGIYVLNSVPTVAEQLAICNKYDPATGKLQDGWDHPPMLLGVEYRTTERYLGKPVYVKLVALGEAPSTQSTKVIFPFGEDYSAGTYNVFSVDAHISNSPNDGGWTITMPYFDNGNLTVSIVFSGSKINFYSSGMAGYYGFALLKYIKTTD